MGKSNKPTKWFKAVKKAFRSPSKERLPSPDHQDSRSDHADEKLLSKQYDHSPARLPEPTPHPLPSFEIITHEEAEPEHSRMQHPLPQPLPTPEAVDPAIAANYSKKMLENLIDEDEIHESNGGEADVVEKQQQQPHQQDDDEDSVSEEEEAALRLQQRFSEPPALKGLIRIQALVRGHQVRSQAATTLTTMEAIVRVQSVFRGRCVRMSKDGRAVRSRISKRRRLSSRAGLHVDASRGGLQYHEPQVIRGDQEALKQKRPTAYLFTQQLKRSAPNRSSLYIDCDPGQPHWGWVWLELWSSARPWEARHPPVSKTSSTSKDFIEIIPSRKHSEYTTKEVDVNTLKVKYYEDYVSNPTPAKSRSSNPTKELAKSSNPTYTTKEPLKSSAKESAKSSSPSHTTPKDSTKSPSTQREPVKSSSDKRELLRSSSSSEKRELGKASTEKTKLPEKKEPVRSSRSFSEKKESIRAQWTSPFSDKKTEPLRSPSSPFSEKKTEPLRSPSSPFSDKKTEPPSSPFSERKTEPLPSPSSPFSEKTEPLPSPSSPFSEKTEPEDVVPDWRAPTSSPVPIPTSPPSPLHLRVMPKPPPIGVPSLPAMDEDQAPAQLFAPSAPEAPTSPKSPPKSPVRENSVPPSPAGSENSLPIPPSPQGSDNSLPVPETPPGLDSAGDDPALTTDHVVMPEVAHNSSNGGEINGGELDEGEAHSNSCLSPSNEEHLLGDDTQSTNVSISDVMNGHTSTNGYQENGDSKSPTLEKVGENGDSPVPSKRPTCRYMVPTESAKAKFRSSSNPKTRAPDSPITESPVRTTPKRYSIGSSPTVMSKGTDSPKTAFGTRRTNSFLSRGTPSPKSATPKEKPRSAAEPTGAESPARRNSLGGDKRWRT